MAAEVGAARGPLLRWALGFVVAASLVWRLPSLFDPPWVNDEGTYYAVAQAMAHGYRLYADIWENKPPALYLVYSAVYHLVGPSLLAIRLVATASALASVHLAFLLARRYAGAESALLAAMLTGLLLAVPFLEGTTGNAELFLALLMACAVYVGIAQDSPGLAGLAAAGAVLFKAVAGFDAAALAIWLYLHRRRRLGPYLGALLCSLGVAALAAGLSGILPAMVRDAFLYDLGYVAHGNGGGVPWLLLLKLAALAGLTLALRRAPFPWLWLAFAAAGALFSGRIFGHYLLQCVVPVSLCVALLMKDRPRASRRAVIALPCLFLAGAAASALLGWGLIASGHDSILARRLQWYPNFVRMAVGAESYAQYRMQVDDAVARNIRVAAIVDSLPPGRILVWGNTPWVYVLSHRLPATPYTSAVRQPAVPGEMAALRGAVRVGVPREVVVIWPPDPPLGSAEAALSRRYRRVTRVGKATIYLRAGRVDCCRASTRATARASSGTR
jgi:4-amino-4-deoxy-L-arabinose transferase-like glycosyltransferase